ncbi:hypothetical protein A0H81_01589 [Grifola frondosa]|uniref:Uncharacterized protein n=1 Tax=Grifola frondosa TaxID=5627 RepID=A0A1C7MLZ6_GRIFR|nr:hypothetical protein A0H81_01589 [Grifola frondosa]
MWITPRTQDRDRYDPPVHFTVPGANSGEVITSRALPPHAKDKDGLEFGEEAEVVALLERIMHIAKALLLSSTLFCAHTYVGESNPSPRQASIACRLATVSANMDPREGSLKQLRFCPVRSPDGERCCRPIRYATMKHCRKHHKEYCALYRAYKDVSAVVKNLELRQISQQDIWSLRCAADVEEAMDCTEQFLKAIRTEIEGCELHGARFIENVDDGHTAYLERLKKKETIRAVLLQRRRQLEYIRWREGDEASRRAMEEWRALVHDELIRAEAARRQKQRMVDQRGVPEPLPHSPIVSYQNLLSLAIDPPIVFYVVRYGALLNTLFTIRETARANSDEPDTTGIPTCGLLKGLDTIDEAKKRSWDLGLRASAVVAHAAVLAFTWKKTFRLKAEASEAGVKTSFASILMRDGTIYFLALLVVNIADMVVNQLFLGQFIYPLSTWIAVAGFVLPQRSLSPNFPGCHGDLSLVTYLLPDI